MTILTRLQAVQIARQAQQHFEAFDRRHRYEDAAVYEQTARLLNKEGFVVYTERHGVVCINSDGTRTRVRKIGQQFRAEVRRCETLGH